MWPRSENLKPVNEEWHINRIEARRTAFNPDEFGDVDREAYDLDDAGITGEDNPDTYDYNRALDQDGTLSNGRSIKQNPRNR